MSQMAGRRIFERVRGLPEFSAASSVACYYPIGSEVPTHDIMREAASRGKRVCLPRVSSGGMIVFRYAESQRDLELGGWGDASASASSSAGMFGVMEPKESCPECDSPDLIIVPAVGVTTGGARLGYGRGYYDRYLAAGPGRAARAAALAFHKQVVGSIPCGDGDVPVECLVTERGVFRAA